METKGTFHGTEIDYRDEYIEARRLMGLKSTDLDLLHEKVALMYVNCPDDMTDVYLALMDEIGQRKTMTEFKTMFEGMSSKFKVI